MTPPANGVPVRKATPWSIFLALLLLLAAPVAVQAKPPTVAQLQAKLRAVTQDRDDLKDRLAATESLQSDLVEAQKSRDLARQETAASRKELEQMKSALADNQSGTDVILSDLRKAKADLAACTGTLQALKGEAETRKDKLGAPASEGALVVLTPEIIPARPMNLAKITPKARKVSGVVVVNVLISEKGDVLGSRLIQGLRGEGEWVDKANAACVEAAKLIVFDPARAADGKTRLKVWQGVGFLLN